MRQFISLFVLASFIVLLSGCETKEDAERLAKARKLLVAETARADAAEKHTAPGVTIVPGSGGGGLAPAAGTVAEKPASGTKLATLYSYTETELNTVPATIKAVLVRKDSEPNNVAYTKLMYTERGAKDNKFLTPRAPQPGDVVYMLGIGGEAELKQYADGRWYWTAK